MSKKEFSKKGKRYINPETGKYWRRGEIRADGKIFSQIFRSIIKRDGYYKHSFYSPDAFLRRQIDHSLGLRKVRAKKVGIKVSLDINYLFSIFPKDYLCPILGTKMVWSGGDNKNSPSLDRIVPSKGYVEGNVVWISSRANLIKQDASSEEIEKVAEWLKKKNL